MSFHPFDKLPLSDGGTLIFTPCPGTKEVDLRTALAQLAQAGATAVITVMPDEEMARNNVSALPEACGELGLKWFHFPIADDTSPGADFRQAWEKDRNAVFDILSQQGIIAIHCKGGSGRTGLMAAIVMFERGMSHEQIVDQVTSLRPNALKLPVHTDYLAQTYSERANPG